MRAGPPLTQAASQRGATLTIHQPTHTHTHTSSKNTALAYCSNSAKHAYTRRPHSQRNWIICFSIFGVLMPRTSKLTPFMSDLFLWFLNDVCSLAPRGENIRRCRRSTACFGRFIQKPLSDALAPVTLCLHGCALQGLWWFKSPQPMEPPQLSSAIFHHWEEESSTPGAP